MRLSPAARGVLAALAATAVSVAGEAAQPEPTAGITVAWDANPEANIAGYIVYVGEAPNQYQQVFDVGSSTSFTFSGALEGHRYHFAVAAYADGRVEGPLSNEVSAELTSNTVSHRQSARCAESSRDCGSIDVLAGNLARVDALAALDAGRLLAIEGGRSIRVITPEGLQMAPALVDARDETTYVALAADPRFDRTHAVYVGTADRSRAGERLFNVARYRELNGVLGEGAVIVSALPLAVEGEPSLAIDADGRIYVSLPGGPTSRDPYAGHVLRFTADGSADGAFVGSPILAAGYEHPSALAWDGETMWSVGESGPVSQAAAVAHLRDRADVEAAARSAIGSGWDRSIREFAAREVSDGQNVAALTWLNQEGQLARVRLGADASVTRLAAVSFEAAHLPTAVAIGVSGEIYAAVPDPGGTFTVLRLAAQGGKF